MPQGTSQSPPTRKNARRSTSRQATRSVASQRTRPNAVPGRPSIRCTAVARSQVAAVTVKRKSEPMRKGGRKEPREAGLRTTAVHRRSSSPGFPNERIRPARTCRSLARASPRLKHSSALQNSSCHADGTRGSPLRVAIVDVELNERIQMTNTTLIAIVAVVAIAAVVVAWIFVERRKRTLLKARFGPEYERTVHEAGTPRKAESLLERREKRVSTYRIRRLTPEELRHFQTRGAGCRLCSWMIRTPRSEKQTPSLPSR